MNANSLYPRIHVEMNDGSNGCPIPLHKMAAARGVHENGASSEARPKRDLTGLIRSV